MKTNVYAIKDTKIGFESPFLRVNDDAAKRDFFSAAKFAPEPNRFQQTPADYELYRLGSFDTATGIFESNVEYLCNLIGIVKE